MTSSAAIFPRNLVTANNTLWLSRHSLDEHLKKHPEVRVDDYRAIPDIVRNGQVWGGHSPRRYLLLWIGGKPYRAAIKADSHCEGATANRDASGQAGMRRN